MDTEAALDRLFAVIEERKPADIFLSVDGIFLKIRGSIVRLEHSRLSKEELEGLVSAMIGSDVFDAFRKGGREVDTAYMRATRTKAGVRINVFNAMGKTHAVLRVIDREIKGFGALGIPEGVQRILEDLCRRKDGLVLVAGRTGSGKSSTLRAMVRHINETRDIHLLWVEDPQEVILKSIRSIVTQRQLGQDTKNWLAAMKAALRQSADVIVLGEIRSPDVMDLALDVAQTGHLVLGTYHGGSVVEVVDRILGGTPASETTRATSQLVRALAAIVVQQLIPREDGGDGRVPALEVMRMNADIERVFRENKLGELGSHIEKGVNEGMRTMRQALEGLAERNRISWDSVHKFGG